MVHALRLTLYVRSAHERPVDQVPGADDAIALMTEEGANLSLFSAYLAVRSVFGVGPN